MKRLNNKGITIVEILLCFVLASLITTSLYNIIETISQAKQNEQAKYQMETQRAYLTKEVLGDIIEDGLSAVTINGSKKDVAKSVTDTPLNLYSSSCKVFDSDTWTCSDSDNYDTEANRKAPNKFYAPATSAILIRFLFKDGTIKELRILKQVNNYKIKTAGGFSTTYGDKFYIAYGRPSKILKTNQIGIDADSSKNPFIESDVTSIDFDSFRYHEYSNGDKIYETKIGNINLAKNNDFVKIDIRYDNVELKQQYGIYIISPNTVEQVYVDVLEMMQQEIDDSSSANGDYDVEATIHKTYKVEDLLTDPITASNFKCKTSTPTTESPEPTTTPTPTTTPATEPDDNYCVWTTKSNSNFATGINLNAPIMVGIYFPVADRSDKYKNTTSQDITDMLQITDFNGTVLKSNGTDLKWNWEAGKYIDQIGIMQPVIVDDYHIDTSGSTPQIIITDGDPEWNKNIYLGTRNETNFTATKNIVIKIKKEVLEKDWNEGEFYISIVGQLTSEEEE